MLMQTELSAGKSLRNALFSKELPQLLVVLDYNHAALSLQQPSFHSLSPNSFVLGNLMVYRFVLYWIAGSNTFLTTSRLLLTTSIRHGMFNLVFWILVIPMAPHNILLMSMYM